MTTVKTEAKGTAVHPAPIQPHGYHGYKDFKVGERLFTNCPFMMGVASCHQQRPSGSRPWSGMWQGRSLAGRPCSRGGP